MIITIIKTLLIAHFVVKFEPIQWLLEIIKVKLNPSNIIGNLIINTISLLTSCSKCAALWTGLLMSGIWVALISSYIMYLYSWIVEPRIEKIINPYYGEEIK